MIVQLAERLLEAFWQTQYATHRQLDLHFLWPSILKVAPDLDTAKAAFASHCYRDPAWLALGHTEIYKRIDELTWR